MKIGIYKITNQINNKIYIGSSTNLIKRKAAHFQRLENGNNHNKHLQRAYNKYGKDNFNFEIIAYCSIDDLIGLEQYYVDKLNPDYNICKIIVTSTLGVTHSTEAKLKMSHFHRNNCGKILYQYDEHLKLIKIWDTRIDFARKYNTSRANVSKSLKLKNKCKGFFISNQEETNIEEFNFKKPAKNKIKHDSKKKQILQFDNNKKLLRCWESIKDLCTTLNISRGFLYKGLQNKIFTYKCKGFYFAYKQSWDNK